MLLSHTHQFIYLKTIKTAGTSVEVYFERYCLAPGEWQEIDDSPLVSHAAPSYESVYGIRGARGMNVEGEKWRNHMPVQELIERLPVFWERYLTFCCVRNPYDKAVSAFWMVQGDEARAKLAASDFSAVRAAFAAYVENSNVGDDQFTCMIGGRACTDRLIRYENLQDDLRAVCRELGIPYEAARLRRFKSHKRVRGEPFQDYYDAASARRVRSIYADYFAAFGYSADL